MNNYETVFILTPVLSEAQVKEAADKFSKRLRKLAYPIQKKSTGFYQLIQFEAEGSFVDTLETEYRRDERIIRFLTFKLDKDMIAYAEKRINKNKTSNLLTIKTQFI